MWIKYLVSITCIIFTIIIIIGATVAYLDVRSAITIHVDENFSESVSTELVSKRIKNIFSSLYYTILSVFGYLTLASVVISTIICVVKKNKK